MRTYLLTIAYHGGGYAGWQRQAGADSVQERLERAFEVLVGEPVVVHGAGRTDAGVHALRQCAHVRLQRDFEPWRLLRALNGNLPDDVVVRGVRRVPEDFHARFSAVGKRYVYRFLCSEVRPVFGRDLFCWVRRSLDVAAMRRAAAVLVGEHDFASFASNPGHPRKRGTVRRVDHVHVLRRPHGVDLMVQGGGFLYNMIRAFAGTLRDVGTGRTPPDRVAEILAARDRRVAGPTAEPQGLYLVRVLYPAASLADGA